ncbi:MAG TPA: CCA tRNA nucleotidyltransferase [Roseiarcus sp.]|nr:CCA tRNA nucleotidyltransferase [Roseiarcus sp.]
MTDLPGLKDGKLRDQTLLQRGPLAEALAALNGGGEETRLVGGAVRDLALGAPTEDYDLATTAEPEEVVRRARSAGFKVALTGVSHGTVTVIVNGRPIETTTLRTDVETYGRRARVAFERDFVSDALRRDFTINALSVGADGKVYDPVGGLEDLSRRRVRFIGDPESRIREDYLRILRFFRFSAHFGGAIDPPGLAAAIRCRAGLASLSRERVRAELLKLLLEPFAGEVTRAMGHSGLLHLAVGGMAYPARLQRLVAIESARGAAKDAIMRLTSLTALVREDAERVSDRLRLSNAEHRRIEAAAAALEPLHGIEAPPALKGLLKLLFSAKRQAARDALALAQAESAAAPDDPAFSTADAFLAETEEPKLPISGADVVAQGVAAGPEIGEILRRFQELWLEAGFPRESETLIPLLAKAIAERFRK